jgi:hypothetical protein
VFGHGVLGQAGHPFAERVGWFTVGQQLVGGADEVPRAAVEEMRGRGVAFEEYDTPETRTENGIARMPGRGEAAWSRTRQAIWSALFHPEENHPRQRTTEANRIPTAPGSDRVLLAHTLRTGGSAWGEPSGRSRLQAALIGDVSKTGTSPTAIPRVIAYA